MDGEPPRGLVFPASLVALAVAIVVALFVAGGLAVKAFIPDVLDKQQELNLATIRRFELDLDAAEKSGDRGLAIDRALRITAIAGSESMIHVDAAQEAGSRAEKQLVELRARLATPTP